MAVGRKPAAPKDAAASVAAGIGRAPEDQSWKPGRLARLVFDGVGIAIGVGYTMLAVDLGVGTAADPGAGFLPRAAGVLIVACLAIDLVVTARAVTRGRPLRGSGRIPLGALAVLAGIGLYLIVVEFLGHALTSALVVALLLTVLGNRNRWRVALIGLVAGFASDLLFTALLGLRLPLGNWDIGWSAWM